MSKFIPVALGINEELSEVGNAHMVIIEVEDSVDVEEIRDICLTLAPSDIFSLIEESDDDDDDDDDPSWYYSPSTPDRLKVKLESLISGVVAVYPAESLCFAV
jgi:hypothetical protein